MNYQAVPSRNADAPDMTVGLTYLNFLPGDTSNG